MHTIKPRNPHACAPIMKKAAPTHAAAPDSAKPDARPCWPNWIWSWI